MFTLLILTPFAIGLFYTIYDMQKKKKKDMPRAESMKYAFIGIAVSMVIIQLYNFIY